MQQPQNAPLVDGAGKAHRIADGTAAHCHNTVTLPKFALQKPLQQALHRGQTFGLLSLRQAKHVVAVQAVQLRNVLVGDNAIRGVVICAKCAKTQLCIENCVHIRPCCII